MSSDQVNKAMSSFQRLDKKGPSTLSNSAAYEKPGDVSHNFACDEIFDTG
jgi:hypothetical protein